MGVACGLDRGMEVKLKPWCCALDTAVGVVGGVMAAMYLVVGVVAVGWSVIQHFSSSLVVGSVVEVDSFDDVYGDLETSEENNATLIVVVIALLISFVGIITSLTLVIGVVRSSYCCLLPWLVWHVVIILSCVGSGLYLVVHFLLLVEEREEDMAVVSAGPVLAGIFLIILWILVDQLYIQLRQTKVTIEVENPIKRSSSSLTMTMMNKHTSSTMRSSRSTRSQLSTSSLRALKKRSHGKRQKELNRKSRSLEHILDSSSNSSSSTYQSEIISCRLKGLTTLPRLRRCRDNPDTFRTYLDTSSYAGHTDTMRSCKSVTSGKSVFIHPQVTEYHYNVQEEKEEDEREEWEDGMSINFSDEADDTIDVVEKQKDNIPTLPPPIYPTIDSKQSWKKKFSENKKIFTKDQIIDLYC